MPSLHCAGVKISLASQPLGRSLTDKVEIKKGPGSASKAEAAEQVLMESLTSPLHEERVQFPGDDECFAVNLVAKAPFLQNVIGRPSEKSLRFAALKQRLGLNKGPVIQQGSSQANLPTDGRPLRLSKQAPNAKTLADLRQRLGLSEGTTTQQDPSQERPPTDSLSRGQSPSTSSPNQDSEPKALVLHVELTDKTFLQTSLDKPQHVKIDVLFNGQLSSSMFINPRDIQTNVKSLHQVFSGTRIDFLVERPWVMHTPPSSSTSDDDSLKSAATGAQDRWVEICKALLTEANGRGIDEECDRPPSAAYLAELATMKMPDSVHKMQKAGGMKYGVIDVIVTVGIGKKVNSGVEYLKTPKQLPDERYNEEVNEDGDFEYIKGGDSPIESTVNEKEANQEEANEEEVNEEGVNEEGVNEEGVNKEGVNEEEESEGPTDSEFTTLPPYTPETASLIMPGQPLPPGPFPRVDQVNPFAGFPIVPPASAASIASFARQVEGKEPPPSMAPPRRAYPSAYRPTDTMSSPYETTPRIGFNVNPYDGFEHANPYQPPYSGIIPDLNSASFDEPAPLPIRDTPSGVFRLSSSQQALEGDAPTTTSSVSKPIFQSFGPQNPESGYVLRGSAPPPLGPGVSGTEGLPPLLFTPSHPFQGTIDPSLVASGAASSPYLEQPRRPSNSQPPPVGLIKVTDKPNTKLSTEPVSSGQNADDHVVQLERVVIRLGTRVVRAHYFTKPCWLVMKAPQPLTIDTNVAPDEMANARKESSNSAVVFPQPPAPRRSSRPHGALATPPETSPNVGSDPTTKEWLNKKKDYTDDESTTTNVVQILETASAPSRRRGDVSDAEKQGVDGPKANTFVMDDPEELLRKAKQKKRNKDRKSKKKAAKIASAAGGAAEPAAPTVPGRASTLRSSTRHSSVATARSATMAPPALPGLTEETGGGAGASSRALRNPDRLVAKTNPVLNHDCVIQYAVSERERGALRQVKSERNGVFKEESVVMGCRYFVAGY